MARRHNAVVGVVACVVVLSRCWYIHIQKAVGDSSNVQTAFPDGITVPVIEDSTNGVVGHGHGRGRNCYPS